LQHSTVRAQAEERRQRIFEHVRANGFASVSDLAVLLSVSEMTIRRDIRALAGRHLLRQVHGGANAILDAGEGIDFRVRVSKRARTKNAIAAAALDYVRPRATIALDSGTTSLELARHLPGNARLLVATHSLPALMALSRAEGTDVVALGGAFQHHTQSFAGPMALTAIRHLRIETFFMGSTSVRHGFTYVGSAFDAQTKVALMDVSDRVILLVDSSKFAQTSLFPIAPIDRLSMVITDSDAPEAAVDELRARGVEVIQVEVNPREAQEPVEAHGLHEGGSGG
jgi:DeoR/GlpR family transcriptional regulator of sugar metabolism